MGAAPAAGVGEHAPSQVPDIGESGRFPALDVQEYERSLGGNGSSEALPAPRPAAAPFELSPPSSESFSAPAPRAEPERTLEREPERMPEPPAHVEPEYRPAPVVHAEPAPPAAPAAPSEPTPSHEHPPAAG